MRRAALAALAAACLLLSACAASGPAETPPATPTPAVTPAPTPEPTPEPTPSPTPEPTPPPTLLGETEDMGQEYQDAIVFYGDSNTNGLRLQELLPGGYNTTQVWTPASGTLTLYLWNAASIVYPETGAEMTIADAVETKKPEYLVITLGVNGVAELEEDAFKIYYTDIINCVKEASPSTRIICNSIYPVENDYEHIDQISNEKINTANGWILDVAEATGTRYADSCSVLKAADGSLREELGNGDGLHLNADGYNAVLEYLRTHAWQ